MKQDQSIVPFKLLRHLIREAASWYNIASNAGLWTCVIFTPSDHSCHASNSGLSSKPVCKMCFHCGNPSRSSSYSGENHDQKNFRSLGKTSSRNFSSSDFS